MTETVGPVSRDGLLEHRRWVYALARSLLSDLHEAEDVTQDAMVALVERPPDKPGAVKGWLRRVVYNSVSNRRRGRRRLAAREHAAARRDAAPSAYVGAARAETEENVVEAVLALEEPYRTTILLHFVEGLALREIAERTGVPYQTAKSRLRRGVAKLRGHLEQRYGEGPPTWRVALTLTLGESALGPLDAAAPSRGDVVRRWTVAAAVALLVPLLLMATGLSPASFLGKRARSTETATATDAGQRGTRGRTARLPAARSAPDAKTDAAQPPEVGDATGGGDASPAPPAPHSFRGRVRHPDGVAVQALRVAAVLKDADGKWGRVPATVHADGTFSLDELPAPRVEETLYVEAEARGFPRTTYQFDLTREGGGTLDLTLDRFQTVRGRVVDPDRKPLAGLRILQYHGILTHSQTRTGADGTFAVELPGGRGHVPYVIHDRPTGPRYVGTFTVRPGWEDGHAVGDVTVDLGTRLSGRVFDPEGRPREGAGVFVRPHYLFGVREAVAATDPNGHFEFPAVSRGRVELSVRWPVSDEDPDRLVGGHVVLDHPTDRAVRIQTRPLFEIRTVVRSAGTEEPLGDQNITVRVRRAGGDGSIDLIRKFKGPGVVRIWVPDSAAYDLEFISPAFDTVVVREVTVGREPVTKLTVDVRLKQSR